MQWKDLFYFSKGERHALTVLLFLITLTWILLHYCSEEKIHPMNSSLTHQTITGQTIPASSYKQEKFTRGTIVELNSADTITLKKYLV
ncbi:MAG: hypothetical protein LIP01_00675 [Tannerellaceae bacterium]|nr:hypothetical protein [Tannerellaceae bacterium]